MSKQDITSALTPTMLSCHGFGKQRKVMPTHYVMV